MEYNMESDIKISDLKISSIAKETMQDLGILYVSDLHNYNFYKIVEKDNRPTICAVVKEFMDLDYLLPSEDEICIYDIDMSTKLRNFLIRNQIMFLSQLKYFSQERLLDMRNMGKVTFHELLGICNSYEICLKSILPIKMTFCKYGISDRRELEMLFQNNIYTLDDLLNISNMDLYKMFGYQLAMKLYYKLKENYDINSNPNSYLIFEITTYRQANELRKHRIETLDDLSECTILEISKFKYMNSTTLKKLSNALSHYGLSFKLIAD